MLFKKRQWTRKRGSIADLVASKIGLAVGIILIVIVVVVAGQVKSQIQNLAATYAINEAVSATQSAKGGRSSYDEADLTEHVINRGSITGMFVTEDDDGNSVVRSMIGGGMTITGLGATFSVTVPDLSNDACITLADSYVGSNSANGSFVGAQINGSDIEGGASIADVSAACDEGAGANSITLEYR